MKKTIPKDTRHKNKNSDKCPVFCHGLQVFCCREVMERQCDAFDMANEQVMVAVECCTCRRCLKLPHTSKNHMYCPSLKTMEDSHSKTNSN